MNLKLIQLLFYLLNDKKSSQKRKIVTKLKIVIISNKSTQSIMPCTYKLISLASFYLKKKQFKKDLWHHKLPNLYLISTYY